MFSQPVRQRTDGGVHGLTHMPSAQSWPGPHRRPHAPQFAGSRRVSVQPPSHMTSGERHELTHMPS